MSRGVEEEEFGNGKGANDHDDRGGDDGQQSDDVHGADDIEDDEAWAGEAFGRERHCFFAPAGEEIDCGAPLAFSP